MSQHRLTMHKTKEILRLKWVCKLSNRKIGQSCLVSPSTVFDCLARAAEAGLDWDQVTELDEEKLEAYPLGLGPPTVTRVDV